MHVKSFKAVVFVFIMRILGQKIILLFTAFFSQRLVYSEDLCVQYYKNYMQTYFGQKSSRLQQSIFTGI